MFISGAKPASGMMEMMQQGRADAKERQHVAGSRRIGGWEREVKNSCVAVVGRVSW